MVYDIIIIGASGGIGETLIDSFTVNHPSNNIIATFNKSKINTDALLFDQKLYIKTYNLDITSLSSQQWFINNIKDDLKSPVLIYTAGVSINNPVSKYGFKDWQRTMDVNLTGAFSITQMILPIMKELKFGRIIYMSSVLSRIAVPGTCAYSVTKAGLNALAKAVSKENAKYGILANSIALGYSEVGIIENVPKEYLDNTVIPNIPVGKLCQKKEISRVVKTLIETDYISGATIDVNGGIY